jgi:hypothetical protein
VLSFTDRNEFPVCGIRPASVGQQSTLRLESSAPSVVRAPGVSGALRRSHPCLPKMSIQFRKAARRAPAASDCKETLEPYAGMLPGEDELNADAERAHG